MSKSLIENPVRAKQLIDFQGIGNNGLYPTDIDGFFEYRDKGYIFFEVKWEYKDLTGGQKLALERIYDDIKKLGKIIYLVVLSHDVEDPNEVIYAEKCMIREYYIGNGDWRVPVNVLSVADLVNQFMKQCDAHTVPENPYKSQIERAIISLSVADNLGDVKDVIEVLKKAIE